MNSNRITQEAMGTEYQMGNTCSRKTTNVTSNKLVSQHDTNLKAFFEEAIKHEWVLVLIIDDFTKIHTNRRPTIRMSNPMSMCTIVVNAFKSLKAIKVPRDIFNLHCPDGVNVQACVEAITSPQQLTLSGT